jgi:hypothetical protein
MITSDKLMDLGFVPLIVNKTIAFSINERCQGVLSGGVFFFKLKADGEYFQANNVNHLKWLYKREHKEKLCTQ